MFTGIVAGLAEVSHLTKKDQLWQVELRLPAALSEQLQIGGSIAANGTCLTLVSYQGDRACFDVMMETLRLTNLACLKTGDFVNVERAARLGDEIGGHLLSGHIHDQARILAIETPPDNRILTLEVAEQWAAYLLPKGFVALDGASLTIANVQANRFKVYLIPETCRMTTLGFKRVGDTLNLEIDSQTQAIVDTVQRVLANPSALNPS
ncbi:MAG TPA: riboflavin synthase subunit alpha [Pseudomonadales bacterium]|nr:riboflavin synthase subunit alpha [Pseudomonadales bacterium]